MAIVTDSNSKSPPVKGGVETTKRHKHKPRRNDTKDNDSDTLSDIDDDQIIGYFNNKLEMQYKTILWEALNREHTNATKQKRTMEPKKRGPVKKAKTDEKVEVRKRSSKINYDALKALNEEFGEDSAVIPNTGADYSSYQAEDEHDIGRDNGSLGDYTDDGWYEF